MGRVFTRKPVNKGALEAAFNNIWERPEGFKVEEIKPRIFQFFFDRELDVERVLEGGPWLFRNAWLILKRWDRSLSLNEDSFNMVKMWI